MHNPGLGFKNGTIWCKLWPETILGYLGTRVYGTRYRGYHGPLGPWTMGHGIRVTGTKSLWDLGPWNHAQWDQGPKLKHLGFVPKSFGRCLKRLGAVSNR